MSADVLDTITEFINSPRVSWWLVLPLLAALEST
jgi:hypothetical protein